LNKPKTTPAERMRKLREHCKAETSGVAKVVMMMMLILDTYCHKGRKSTRLEATDSEVNIDDNSDVVGLIMAI
jgi:hypothetical protein